MNTSIPWKVKVYTAEKGWHNVKQEDFRTWYNGVEEPATKKRAKAKR